MDFSCTVFLFCAFSFIASDDPVLFKSSPSLECIRFLTTRPFVVVVVGASSFGWGDSISGEKGSRENVGGDEVLAFLHKSGAELNACITNKPQKTQTSKNQLKSNTRKY